MKTYLHVCLQMFASLFCVCTEHWHSCFIQVRKIKLYFVLLEFCMLKCKSASPDSLCYNHIKCNWNHTVDRIWRWVNVHSSF